MFLYILQIFLLLCLQFYDQINLIVFLIFKHNLKVTMQKVIKMVYKWFKIYFYTLTIVQIKFDYINN